MSPSQKPTRPPAKQAKKATPLGQSQTKPWVRVVIVAIIAVLALGGIVAIFAGNDSSSSDSASSSSTGGTTATTAAAMPSAAGKPCVAVNGPLPAGAPTVPVEVGPPPATLVSKDLQVGTGAEAAAGSNITVDYIGVACSTGKVFDASYGKQPATFALDQVIPGWSTGIPGMKVGGTRLLGIPAAQAYGAQGYPPDIAPDEALWFVVQLKSVNPAAG